MTRLIRCCLALVMGLLVIDLAAAQDGVEKPFAEYADAPARYLKRLHGEGTPDSSVGALSFRSDYPGGFGKSGEFITTRVALIMLVSPVVPPVPESLRTALNFQLLYIQVGRKFDDAYICIDVPAEIIDPFELIGTEYGISLHLIGKIYDILSVFTDALHKG